MRIGLNLLGLGERSGGAGRYATELGRALLAEPGIDLTVFVSRAAPRDSLEALAGARVVELPISLGIPTLLATHVALPPAARALRLDVLHGPANIGPAMTPGVARVVTVLDLIWWHHPYEWEGSRRAHAAIRRQTLLAARSAHRVLAISEHAAEDLHRTLEIPTQRIGITPLGVGAAPAARPTPAGDLRARLRLGDAPVILSVAQRRPYKNLGALVRALPGLPGAVLVLVGAPTDHDDELRALARELGVADRLRMEGYVAEVDLEGLYALAAAFALPSLIEGFGLPALEAMCRGVPVAVSSTTALGEVVGDAGLTFDPADQEAVTSAISRLLRDSRLAADLRERGRARAAVYTWQATARATLAAYEAAIDARANA